MVKKLAIPAGAVRVHLWALVLCLNCLCITGYAQSVSPTPTALPTNTNANPPTDSTSRPPANLTTNPPPVDEVTTDETYLSEKEFITTLTITIASLLTLLMQTVLLWRMKNVRPEDVLRNFTITFIIMGALFGIASGFSASQLTPVIGLFGAIVGYLLGAGGKRNDESVQQKKGVDKSD